MPGTPNVAFRRTGYPKRDEMSCAVPAQIHTPFVHASQARALVWQFAGAYGVLAVVLLLLSVQRGKLTAAST